MLLVCDVILRSMLSILTFGLVFQEVLRGGGTFVVPDGSRMENRDSDEGGWRSFSGACRSDRVSQLVR